MLFTFYFRNKLKKGGDESSHQRSFLAHISSAVPKVYIVMSCYWPNITHLHRVMFLFSPFKSLLSTVLQDWLNAYGLQKDRMVEWAA